MSDLNARIAELEEQLRLAKRERRQAWDKPRDEPGGILYWTIGKKIREMRGATGISQEELGKRVDLLRTSIVNIECGRQRLPIATLYDIADALGVQAIALFAAQ